MRYFTEGIDKYLANWIQFDTWYTPQDIEDRFYAFVMAIGHNSRPLADAAGPSRHPRTYDKVGFVEKVLLAIERNWPDFDQKYARKRVEQLADKAMTILDAIWHTRRTNHRQVKQIDLANFK